MDPTEDWSGNAKISNDQKPQENENETVELSIGGYPSFDDYVQEAFDAMRAGIKAANNLPVGENYNYYQCFPSFIAAKDRHTKNLLDVMQHVLGAAGVTALVSKRDIEEKFEILLETNDIFLDRANALMDEESGIARNAGVELVISQARKESINGSWNHHNIRSQTAQENAQSVRLLAGKNVHRPQLMFKDKIDNRPRPWCPRIKDKPNSLKPLAIYLEEGENGEVFNHPYECELDKFVPPEKQLKRREPMKYKSLEETPLIVIESPSDLKILLEDLKKYNEIAVDLEHHSYRSFQGITCLMQISTGQTDYLIDTLTLRSELHELNEVFTKPTVLKVFHGADLDIQWLQRDLSLYVVNMFDTHQAAKQLNLPYLSLAYLLKQYCNIDPNKHFQLADWRIRPLPEELQKYAREDTHYLLHIKDVLQNALIDTANGQTNILKAVYDRSTEICRKTYVKPIWTEESYMNMYRKSQKMFNNKQLYALREIHKWRDQTAREEDDSTAYVLPNHMLLNIAQTLPREMQGILACCNPIPPLVRQNLLKLHKIVLKAREQPLIKPVLAEDLRQRLVQRNCGNSEAWMYCPHDIPSGTEARADLPCLLDNIDTDDMFKRTVVKHTVTVFDSPATSEDEESNEGTSTKKKFVFVSPFERYKRVIPMVAAQEARDREKQEKQEEERLNILKKEEEATEQSKNRVYEHFKEISQIGTAETPAKKKPSQVALAQMQGRKRKRESNAMKKESQEESDNFLTPVPSLNVKIKQGTKKETETALEIEEKKIQDRLTIAHDEGTDATTIKPIRAGITKKKEKQANRTELQEKGLLPSKSFDYKTVDFSSFQGGSKNSPNQVEFEQTTKKKREKRRAGRRKKRKINV